MFVYQSWASVWSDCVSKVHLSCWTRWQKPARIKELGLWPTLTFSALSTRNESAPSSNSLCDIGWAHGGGKSNGVSCSPQAPSLWCDQACFDFTSRINCTWTQRKHLGGRSWSRPLSPSPIYKVFCLLYIVKLPNIKYMFTFHFFEFHPASKGEPAVGLSLLQLVF